LGITVEMFAKEFIIKDIPVLKTFDTVEYVLTLMDDFKLRHLPVVNEGLYQGLLSEHELLAITSPQNKIGSLGFLALSVSENANLNDILSQMTRYNVDILPVVTAEGMYKGAITCKRLIDILSDLLNVDTEGSIVVLEVAPQDYLLSDISRIVESNNARIINMYSQQDNNTGRLLITIKMNVEDASPVIRSFERFNYSILYHFMKQGAVDELLQQRMNELLHYMNL